MATTKIKSGNLVHLLRIAFDEVNKKFKDKKVEFQVRCAYNRKPMQMEEFTKKQNDFWLNVAEHGRDPSVKLDVVRKEAIHNKPNLHAFPVGFNFEKDYLPLKVENILNTKDYDEEIFDILEIKERYAKSPDSSTYYLKTNFTDIFRSCEVMFLVDKTLVGSVAVSVSYRGGFGERFELYFKDSKGYTRGSTVVPKTIRRFIQTHMYASERTEEMFFEQKLKELESRYHDNRGYNDEGTKARTFRDIRNDIHSLVSKYNFKTDEDNYNNFGNTLNNIIGMKEGGEYHSDLLLFSEAYQELLDEYNYLDYFIDKNTPNSRKNIKFINYVNNKYSIVSGTDSGAYVRDYYDSPEDFPEEIRDKYALLSTSDEDIFYVGFILGDCYAVTLDRKEGE